MPSRNRLRDRIALPLRRVYRLLRGLPPIPNQAMWTIGGRLSMGRHSYHRPLVRSYPGLDSVRVEVGNFCGIGADVVVIPAEHPIDRVSTFGFRVRFGLDGRYEDDFPFSKGDVVIGSDVMIGLSARILSGVTIGDGAVIGASAVVTKDVRPYAVVVGNPAREVRRRFSDDRVEALLRIRWWDWSDEKVFDVVPLLNDPGRVDEFIERFDPTLARTNESAGNRAEHQAELRSTAQRRT